MRATKLMLLAACAVAVVVIPAAWSEAGTRGYTNSYPGRGVGVTCLGNAALDGKGNVTSCTLAQNAGYTNSYPGRGVGITCKGGAGVSFDPANGNVASCTLAQNAGYTNVFPGKSTGISCRGGSSIRFDAKGNVSC